MEKMKKKKKFNKFVAFALAGISALSIASFSAPLIASAEDKEYSLVITDLEKDKNFSVDDYPLIADNYAIGVIQIAESVNDELFVYTYQPSASLEHKATSINMSVGENLDPNIYDLTYLNNSETLFKYKVDNFACSEEELRIYDITSIFRAFDKNIDEETGNDNTISQVSYEVGKIWSAQEVNGKTIYSCLDTETIDITDKWCGEVRYPDGFHLHPGFTDCYSHFVAFNTDKPIDKLMEADVYFVEHQIRSINSEIKADIENERVVHIDGEQQGSFSASGLFGLTYKWKRIEKVEDFLKEDDLNFNEQALSNLENKEWVLRFYETEYFFIYDSYTFAYTQMYSSIKDVSILRLKFETAGMVYDLGVVDNMQTSDGIPDAQGKSWWDKLAEWFKAFLITLACLFAVLILSMFFPTLFPILLNFIWTALLWLFKALWWLFTTPMYIFDENKE